MEHFAEAEPFVLRWAFFEMGPIVFDMGQFIRNRFKMVSWFEKGAFFLGGAFYGIEHFSFQRSNFPEMEELC